VGKNVGLALGGEIGRWRGRREESGKEGNEGGSGVEKEGRKTWWKKGEGGEEKGSIDIQAGSRLGASIEIQRERG
jgi:hypothetical protein